MTLYTELAPDLIHAWNHLVRQTPGSDVTQLSAWSNLRMHVGFLPLYLLAHHEGRLVGGALVLQRQLPLLGVVGYLPYGPVIAAGQARVATVRAVSDGLADLGRRHLGSLFVQPPEGCADVSDQLLARGFRRSTAGIAPQASIRIDLTRGVEELRSTLSKTNRRGIRNSAARGVTVRIGCERDLPVVADLMAHTARYQHFDPPTLKYLARMYRELHPGDHVTVFIAERHGVPAAAELFTGCGGVLKARLTGMARSGPAKKSGAVAAIDWHAILWAKATGYHTFDFGGLTAEAVDTIGAGGAGMAARLTGPDLFKASFGGQPFRYPAPVELI
ncbi:MAG: lipid II:glycine glycyltransferase FemX, partial [Actinomycetes bacterium]